MRQILFIVYLSFAAFISDVFASSVLPPPDATTIPLAKVPGTSLPAPAPSPFPPSDSRLYPKVTGDPVRGARLIRQYKADPNATYVHPYEPKMDSAVNVLPIPSALPAVPKHLSLNEAIALALRYNPNVKISELQRILDKFGLEVVIKTYGVVWNPLTLSSTLQNKVYPTWAAGEGFGVTALSGTNFQIAHTNNLLGGLGSSTLTLTQPLLQGFGFEFNRIPYQNALDTEGVARLTFKNSIMTVVVAVITNYRALVAAYNSLATNIQTLKDQEATVAQSRLQVKVGQMAPSDLLQQQTNLEATRLSVVQEQDSLRDAYQSFLSSLGMIPSTQILIDQDIVVDNTKIPSYPACVALALKYNIAYRQALLQLNITKRALIQAENARKWSLNVSSSVVLGSQRSGVGQPILPINTNPTLALNLSVPIDNVSLKQGVVSAQVQIEDAKLTLEQQKEDLIRQVMNQWSGIQNQYQQIVISELGVKLQEKTLENAELKLKYGKSSVFEVNNLTTGLLSQKVALINTKIAYLNQVTALSQTLGITLHEWHIKLRY
ncbi:MAG: hypothetical protein A3F13_00085 [Gammaproteobacteria bacterium RIFCSPHIGHO2_12_FULL_40_19]|nr:MAG: hypothetical protein A3F13_00085 [Gammaproteobacteria bacterium RIFCSPHIGHO2_12_FULL_40_19]